MRAQAEVEKLSQHRSDFECPVGLPLVQGIEDLEGFYGRLLPEGGEAKAEADIQARLAAVEGLVPLAADPARLGAELAMLVEPTFRDPIESL